jgi:hypothetical protein
VRCSPVATAVNERLRWDTCRLVGGCTTAGHNPGSCVAAAFTACNRPRCRGTQVTGIAAVLCSAAAEQGGYACVLTQAGAAAGAAAAPHPPSPLKQASVDLGCFVRPDRLGAPATSERRSASMLQLHKRRAAGQGGTALSGACCKRQAQPRQQQQQQQQQLTRWT